MPKGSLHILCINKLYAKKFNNIPVDTEKKNHL